MKDFFNRWLSNYCRFAGVLACGLHYPDHAVFSLSLNPAYPAQTLDPVWRCLSDTMQIFQHNRLQAGLVRWVYEKSHVYACSRPDGVCVGIFVAADADGSAHEQARLALQEFMKLRA